MTDFKAIKGFTVQSIATDPKVTGIPGATWASGGNLNTARSRAGAGATGNTTETWTYWLWFAGILR